MEEIIRFINVNQLYLQSKGFSDRRGWSFRKRSARHRVLSNTIISEVASSANKESPEPTTVNFQVEPNSNIPERTSAVQCTDEKTESTQVSPKLLEIIGTREDDTGADAIPDESVVIVIQTAIRRFLVCIFTILFFKCSELHQPLVV